MTLVRFAELAGATIHGIDPGTEFLGYSLDSRAITPGNLFIAIKGKRSDGHDHASEAIGAGAVAALVEWPVDAPHLLVKNLVEALSQFGAARRNEFNGPVIAITGSNGKTATKEFTAAACAPLGEVLKSPANHNTEYTAPLVWDALTPETRIAVVEMGMRGLGQIAHLCKFSRPTIGVITMIGTAHVEMVGSREGIAEAKAELLAGLEPGGTSILWAEDDFYGYLRERAPAAVRTFGFSPDAECRVLGYRALSWDRCIVRGSLDGVQFETELPTVGRHQALNAAAAILAAHTAGVGVEDAANAIRNAILPPLRMELRSVGKATVLLDTYNASPDSTVAAIKTLAELPAAGSKRVVLGEMRELGSFAETGHRQVGRVLGESPVDEVLLFGELTKFIESEAIRAGMDPTRIRHASKLSDVANFLEALQPGDLVLMKGSRALELESAVPLDRGVSTR
ncbi:MAG: UDP-N-acetylmuramoyl-tripeptide--D-alanyl-D-alanine ligase [Fimbriimonadaceae bacterium]|nr:UDP-N-acetylmuramoyl-tripeptide--D-alanyl-D-alanine ligase [Fimbriimonadaceae bacterium]